MGSPSVSGGVILAPGAHAAPRSLSSSVATKDGKNGPCLQHRATTVVDWDAPTSASVCKKSHSHAGVQERINRLPIMPAAILGSRLALLRK